MLAELMGFYQVIQRQFPLAKRPSVPGPAVMSTPPSKHGSPWCERKGKQQRYTAHMMPFANLQQLTLPLLLSMIIPGSTPQKFILSPPSPTSFSPNFFALSINYNYEWYHVFDPITHPHPTMNTVSNLIFTLILLLGKMSSLSLITLWLYLPLNYETTFWR